MPDIVKVTIVAGCGIPSEEEAEANIRRRFDAFLPGLKSTGFPRASIQSVSFVDEGEGTGPVEAATPASQDLPDLLFDDLYKLAQERDIDGRSNMSKAELVEALS